MVTLLTGENEYEIRELRARIIAEFREAHGVEAVKVVDATQVTTSELPQLLTGASLFAPTQLVVLDDAAQKDIWEKLEQYLPESEDMLIVAAKADKRTRTYKWLQKNAEVRECKLPDERALVSWLQNEARRHGIELSAELARYMIEYVGTDQWRLSGDAEKLALAGKPVTRELIHELLIPSPQASAFELLDAALSGQSKRVDELLSGVRANEDPYRFFGLLANQIYAILVVPAAGNRSPDEVAKASGLHPFVVRKTGSVARRLNKSQRDHLAEVVATLDMQLKSSGMDPWTLITVALKNIAA